MVEKNIYGGGPKTTENGKKAEKKCALEKVLIDNGYIIRDKRVFNEQQEIGLITQQSHIYKDIFG